VSTHTPRRPLPAPPAPAPAAPAGSRGARADLLLAAALGAALGAIAFTTGGGVIPNSDGELAANTWLEIALVALGAASAGAVLLWGRRERRFGAGAVGAFAALTAYTATSIAWSSAPDTSWRAADQALAYLAAFGGAAALARLAPARWRALPAGLAAGASAVAGFSLLAKVFPATLAAHDSYGRLDLPLHYWNALGLAAAMGLPACLWLASRRDAGARARACAVPAIALLWAVVILSYSRSALLAAVAGCGLWLALAPARLRGVMALALGGAGAAAICAWALARPALTADNQPLGAREAAGHAFGWVILAALVLCGLAAAGAFALAQRRPLSTRRRRRLGIALLCLLALVPFGAAGALAASRRGLAGEVSHLWSEATSTSSHIGDSPGRLAAVANSRPRYWKEGLTVGEHAPLLGVGALAFETAAVRYHGFTLLAGQAHSYAVETFADLGAIGLAFSLALLAAWGRAAIRPLLPARSPPPGARAAAPGNGTALAGPAPLGPPALALERAGAAALAGAALAFGVQSSIDWSWFIPAVSVPALACAGWLAGRGPLAQPVGRLPRRRALLSHPRLPLALTVVLLAALGGAWVIQRPLAAVQDDAAAVAQDAGGELGAALADARAAVASDPFSLQARGVLSALESAAGQPGAARAQLLDAVRQQPRNYRSWQLLGQFDLAHGRPRAAARELRRAARLDLYDPALAQLTAAAAAAAGARPRTPAGHGRGRSAWR
jgi:hypothetical protein